MSDLQHKLLKRPSASSMSTLSSMVSAGGAGSSSCGDHNVLALRERWAKVAQLAKESKAKLTVTDKAAMTIDVDPVSEGYLGLSWQQFRRYWWTGDSCQQTVDLLRELYKLTQQRLEMFESQHQLNVVHIKDKQFLVDSETRLYKSHAEPYQNLIEDLESGLKGLDVLQATYNDEGIVKVLNKDCAALAKKHRDIYTDLCKAFDRMPKLPPLASMPTTQDHATFAGTLKAASAGAVPAAAVAGAVPAAATLSGSASASATTSTSTASPPPYPSDGKSEAVASSSSASTHYPRTSLPLLSGNPFVGLGGTLSSSVLSGSVLAGAGATAGPSVGTSAAGAGAGTTSTATAIKSLPPVYTTSSSMGRYN